MVFTRTVMERKYLPDHVDPDHANLFHKYSVITRHNDSMVDTDTALYNLNRMTALFLRSPIKTNGGGRGEDVRDI